MWRELRKRMGKKTRRKGSIQKKERTEVKLWDMIEVLLENQYDF